MALAERAVREGCPRNHEHPKDLERKAQRREGFHRKLRVKGTKRQSSHFPLLPRIGIQVYLEQKQSLIAQIGVLETGKGRERYRNPTARCLMLIYLLFSLFTPSLTLEKMNYVYMMCCVNISAFTNF